MMKEFFLIVLGFKPSPLYIARKAPYHLSYAPKPIKDY
jgi:hypothetical protein